MMDPRQVITSLLITLNQKAYILLRIEFLVVAISGLFFAMFIMDFRHNRSHGTVAKSVVKALDGVSKNMVLYTLGAMQAAPFNNQLFPVWAMVVVSFRSSIDYISGYGAQGRSVFVNLMKPLALALLYGRSSQLKVQLWSLWGLMLLKSLHEFVARQMAERSLWNGHNTEFLPEHMRPDHEYSNLKPDLCNPSTMEGYRYLVYGESKQRIRVEKPRYSLYLRITRPRLLITLDKIWQCDGRLLRSNNSRGDELKDLCLAFALSGLLSCRMEDAALHSDCLVVTRNLVRSRVLMKTADRAFRILQLELTFLNERLNTNYPVVFWHGLFSLSLSLVQSLATFAVASWLAVDIHKIYKPPEGDLVQLIRGVNVDIIITGLLMFFMMFKAIWEMVTYLLSDWTRLLLVCKYVQCRCGCMRNSLVEKLIWSFFTSKIAVRWHGLIDQYEFLQSVYYIPSMWNRMHSVTLGLVPSRDDGENIGKAIKLPECVKPAIMQTIRSMNLEGGHLLKEIPSLSATGLADRFGWACELRSCSQVILVWHIATSLCEVELAQERGVDLTKPGFMRSVLSWLKSFCCCSSQPYIVDECILDGDLKTNYLVANSLSRYCAYLLISQPEMLPDSFLLPNLIFQATVRDARDILKDDDSLDSRYKRLIEEANKSIQDNETIKLCGNIVQQGAVLGWDLIQLKNKELCWKILAGVWADLLVHIAPTWNTTAHRERLESGGEFISHIWALLGHFGIEKSDLWLGEQPPAAAGAYQQNAAEATLNK